MLSMRQPNQLRASLFHPTYLHCGIAFVMSATTQSANLVSGQTHYCASFAPLLLLLLLLILLLLLPLLVLAVLLLVLVLVLVLVLLLFLQLLLLLLLPLL